MSVSKDEARRIVEIAEELIVNDKFQVEELAHRVNAEMPQATVDDLRRALQAKVFDFQEEARECAAEAESCKLAMRVIERAQEVTGNQSMATGEAASLMAARGDQEAILLLRELNDPEARRGWLELEAAIDAHPEWFFTDERRAAFQCRPGCPEDTPEKLLTWYRRGRP